MLTRALRILSPGGQVVGAAAAASSGPAVAAGPSVDSQWPIYLDVQATSPMDPRVVDAMLPFHLHRYGNAHSSTHAYGWQARDEVDEARQHVADLINADAREVTFTSGATESNNLALKGVVNFQKQAGKDHIITVSTEHKCVLDSCRYLEQSGARITYLPVSPGGLITPEQVAEAMTERTCLVSVMAVNNEIGVMQPIREIGALCRSRGVLFHTDAAQAVGKIPLDVHADNIDLMSISGHKIYGPKGVGALYVRRRPRVRLEQQMSGGGQERGLRSGTLPVPLCVGLGEAARIAKREREMDFVHVSQLSARLVDSIQSSIPNVVRNGEAAHCYPGCVNLSFAYVEGESLLMGLKTVAISSGSACTSASLEPSYVLRALGTDEELAHSSLRFGIGRFTTQDEVDYTVKHLVQKVEYLRAMSPLWEMVQEGIDLKSIQWSQH